MSAPRSHFKRESVSLAMLAAAYGIGHEDGPRHLGDLTFEDCLVLGPAVVYAVNDVHWEACHWHVPNADAVFIPVEQGRWVTGVLPLVGCRFTRCEIMGISIAATPEQIAAMRPGISGSVGNGPEEPPWYERVAK